MDFIIRECVLEDCMDIVKLNREEMGYDYPENAAKIQLANLLYDVNHKIYVAVIENEIVGYIHANNYDLLYAPHMKNIMGIAVYKAHKKKGIGKALLAKLELWGKETGAVGVRLVSGSQREGAHLFYAKCGYIETKEQKNFKKLFNDEVK